MNRAGVLAALAGVAALCLSGAVHAAEPGGASAAPGAGGPSEPWRREVRDIPRVMMVAATEPWARNNAEVHGLLDKAVADLKTLHESEGAQLAAFEKLAQAQRSGDEQAVKAAKQAFTESRQKVLATARRIFEDSGLLEKKLHEIRPPPPPKAAPRTQQGPSDRPPAP